MCITGAKLFEPANAGVVCAKKRQKNARKAVHVERLDDFYEERYTTNAGI